MMMYYMIRTVWLSGLLNSCARGLHEYRRPHPDPLPEGEGAERRPHPNVSQASTPTLPEGEGAKADPHRESTLSNQINQATDASLNRLTDALINEV